jgi:hypothetical protein
MNDNTKQQRISTYNNAAASTYHDRVRSKTSSPNRTTNRSLSSNAVLISTSREKGTTIRKNDIVTNHQIASEKPEQVRSSRHIDMPPIASDVHHRNTIQQQQLQQQHGYVNGDFTSGQICKLYLRDRSYCHSYNYYGDILAVGTATSLDFYDTSSTIRNSDKTNNGHEYSIITSVPHTAGGSSSMISAILWIDPPLQTPSSLFNEYSDESTKSTSRSYSYTNSSNMTSQQLLAISDLSGRIYLYSINPDILESQGPSLIYCGSNSNGTQIRCLAAGYYHSCLPMYNNNVDEPDVSLIIAVGDKGGCITIVTFDSTLQANDPLYFDTKEFNATHQYNYKEVHMDDLYNRSSTNHNNSSGGILGIAFELERGMMAVCTSSGLIQVFSLSHLISLGTHNAAAMTSDDFNDRHGSHIRNILLWSSQNLASSAIRCIIFGPNNTNTLMYGGYDKTIVLVDIDQWTITRELSVQGTVRCYGQRYCKCY